MPVEAVEQSELYAEYMAYFCISMSRVCVQLVSPRAKGRLMRAT